MMIERTYIVVDEGLSAGGKMAQGGHALAELILDQPHLALDWDNGTLIVLEVEGWSLLSLQSTLLHSNLPVSGWREQDFYGRLTAIASFGSPEVQEILKGLPLSRSQGTVREHYARKREQLAQGYQTFPRHVKGGKMLVRDNVRIWGSDIEEATVQQAMKTSRLSILGGPVALMPDAHVGLGSTVGSVIPTKGAVIPAAIGVDIGCGMAAVKFALKSHQLPDDMAGLMPYVHKAIPAGVGKGHDGSGIEVHVQKILGWTPRIEAQKLQGTAISQCGTLGSGNHFFEVCLDEEGSVWIVLHSGSRGIGNQLARKHIEGAKGLMKERFVKLEDPDLAYLVEGEQSFQNYIEDMLWAQGYAALNRKVMLAASVDAFYRFLGISPKVVRTINCHHNFTQQEQVNGVDMWVTRKGAIKADLGDAGIIPGSMGACTYIVSGLGNPDSYNSCSHGAGRRLSRSQAKKQFTREDLVTAMEGRVWNDDSGSALVDEIPQSYKDIHQVMEDQQDLVKTEHVLSQIFNFKGTK